ncbi:hypothetical protein ACEPAF_412 [Sanghuangporus sanghuang]|uniref:Uncharacterized protein n=1 Tax=Sanghuangporus baumii TaxID=108892 RepID=A0A9Q5HXD4_SANBA|nr:hypothetical protein A7U60_g5256 [Sanghuangporus baumii]
MSSNTETVSQEARQKTEQTAEAIEFDSHPELVKPVGVLDSEHSTLSGKRYADRPEGVDQFGGEESERQRVDDAEMQSGSGLSQRLQDYEGNPGGVDTFGGEDTERKL